MNVAFGKGRTALTGPLTDGSCIRQAFVATADHLESVSILLSTYQRKNPGRLIVEILDTAGEMVGSASVDAPSLVDNKYHRFAFGVQLIEARRYELRIRTEHCRAGASPTAHYSLCTQDGYFFIGSKLIRDRELVCRFFYRGVQIPRVKKKKVRAVSPALSLEKPLPGLISVVIPHYNCTEWLPRCLVSLVYQTYNALQVIVVDDGSEDSASVAALVDCYRQFLPGIQLVPLEGNHGASHARNVGAEKACGEFLFFADADCEFYPKILETMLTALLANPSVSFAYCGFRWGDDFVEPKQFDAEILRRKNYISTMSLMRSSIFTGFDESLRRHQDWDFWLTVVQKGAVGLCAGECLFETPRRSGSISTSENMSLSDSIAEIRKKHGIT